MSLKDKDRDNFFEAVESLKKYRRADVIDESGKSLLEKLYVDLLPNEYVLKKAALKNTTFFIGRNRECSTKILRRKNRKFFRYYYLLSFEHG